MNKNFAYLGLLMATVVWGLNFVVIKLTVGEYPLEAFLFLRFLIGGVFLFALAQTHPKWREGWRSAPRLKLLQLSGIVAVGYIASAIGLRLGVSAGFAAMINSLILVTTPVTIWILHGNRLSRSFYTSLFFAATAVVLIGITTTQVWSIPLVLGVICELISVAAFTLQIVIVEKMVQHVDALTVSGGQLVLLAIMFGVLTAVQGGWQTPTWATLGWIALSGLGASAIAYVLQTLAQKHVDSATVAGVNALEPGFALLFSAMILRTQVNGVDALAVILLLIAALADTSAVRRLENLAWTALCEFWKMPQVYQRTLDHEEWINDQGQVG